MTNTPEPPAGDMLDGADDFAVFFAELTGKPKNLRQVYYWLDRGYIPAGKLGDKWIGFKSIVGPHLRRLAGGEAA